MYKHLLIPIDGSELSIGAVRHGAEFAKSLGAKITLFTVTPPFNALKPGYILPIRDPEEHRQRETEWAERNLATAKAIVDETGIPCETAHIENSRPYEAIIEAAHARGCDLVLMASHGWRGISAVLLGSETMKVLTHSTIPVLVVR